MTNFAISVFVGQRVDQKWYWTLRNMLGNELASSDNTFTSAKAAWDGATAYAWTNVYDNFLGNAPAAPAVPAAIPSYKDPVLLRRAQIKYDSAKEAGTLRPFYMGDTVLVRDGSSHKPLAFATVVNVSPNRNVVTFKSDMWACKEVRLPRRVLRHNIYQSIVGLADWMNEYIEPMVPAE